MPLFLSDSKKKRSRKGEVEKEEVERKGVLEEKDRKEGKQLEVNDCGLFLFVFSIWLIFF